MPPEVNFDLSRLDFNRVVADHEAILRINPQRFEMQQLTAIVFIDHDQHLIVGYKDVRDDEFWVRGHMPGYPLMPGVLMCEAAAQLCGFYTVRARLQDGDFVGFGGMENVRFRGTVKPGDRLVLVAKGKDLRPRRCVFDVQGFVGATMVFHGDIIGVPLMRQGSTESSGEA
jgi:3-hydroxyacyl-[acyl-carrier-protein] dehydratase